MFAKVSPLYSLLLLVALIACGDSTPTAATSETTAGPQVTADGDAPTNNVKAQSQPEVDASASQENQIPPPPTVFAKLWLGDLDGMVERRIVRVLTVYGAGRYYLDGPEEKGLVYEMFQQFENSLNDSLKSGNVKVHVVIIPMARNQLIPALLEGRGDIISAGFTITQKRKDQIAFSDPTSNPVQEILVTGPTAPALSGIEDLSGETVHVRTSSSYRESLEALSKQFEEQGQAPITIEPISELLEDDDLIEMVNSGLLPWAVVDGYKPQLWEGVFNNLVVRDDIVLRSKARLGYAFRKDSPKLAATLNTFLKSHRQGTLLGNMLNNRYLRDFDWAANAMDQNEFQLFEELEDIFKRYGEQYGVEYLFVAAQGYQESKLRQSARSHAGAVGVMQLLPTTAADKNIGIPDIKEVGPNIHAGVKYMAFLRDRYFSDPEITPLNAQLLSLAAYNAGPSRLINLRNKATKLGYDPNVWFDNVEIIAAMDIGRETVQYVANTYKYYLAYQLSARQQLKRKAAREKAGID